MISMVNDFDADSYKIDLQKWKKALEERNKELVIGVENLANYYKDKQVGINYDEERFTLTPQNILSEQEVDFVGQVCAKLASRKMLLDVACGTGRFHPVYELFEKVVMLDSSTEMRQVCRNSSWFNPKFTEFYTSDLLNFKSDDKFDAIICFRLLRHFQAYERKLFFEKVSTLLNSDGVFVFDVPLLQPELSIRESEGWHNYNVYDFFWDFDSLEKEISSLGFSIRDVDYLGKEMVNPKKYKYFEMCCSIHKQ
jgi:SAM-dependent methyltransferase